MNNKKINNSSIKNTTIKQTPIDEYDNIDIEFNLIVPGEKYMRKNKDKGVDRREKIKTVVLYIAVTVSLMVVCYLATS